MRGESNTPSNDWIQEITRPKVLQVCSKELYIKKTKGIYPKK